jgi:hypothetical protein
MNSVMKYILLLVLAGGALVFAGEGLERPPGEPPKGTAVQSDAPGTKLSGVISIELYHIENNGALADARIVLRLRKNNDFDTLYGEAFDIDPRNPATSQAAIVAAMKPQVIDRFFGNNDGDTTNDNAASFNLRTKALEEFGRVNADTTLTGVQGSIFILADVVIAVQ